MAKRKITKAYLRAYIETLDTRCERFDDEKIDLVIDGAFAELQTVTNAFVSEMNVELAHYYGTSDLVFTITTPEDAVSVYDLYLSKVDYDSFYGTRNEAKQREPSMIKRDSQNTDIIHVSLYGPEKYDIAVIKYFYIPKAAEFEDLFISGDKFAALEAAIDSYTYKILHDVEKSGQSRSAMNRLAKAVSESLPQDYSEPGKPSMFPSGV